VGILSNLAPTHQEQAWRDRKAYDLVRKFLLRFPEFPKRILGELKLSPDCGDHQVLKAISRNPDPVGLVPCSVDKLFWLTGSRNSFRSVNHIDRQREDFIAFA
jgi:hypothetical protein